MGMFKQTHRKVSFTLDKPMFELSWATNDSGKAVSLIYIMNS